MERLIEDLTNGNVTEVKVMLATVILALAVYQLLLAAVSYGKLRLRLLESGPATWAHRASGDTILVSGLPRAPSWRPARSGSSSGWRRAKSAPRNGRSGARMRPTADAVS